MHLWFVLLCERWVLSLLLSLLILSASFQSISLIRNGVVTLSWDKKQLVFSRLLGLGFGLATSSPNRCGPLIAEDPGTPRSHRDLPRLLRSQKKDGKRRKREAAKHFFFQNLLIFYMSLCENSSKQENRQSYELSCFFLKDFYWQLHCDLRYGRLFKWLIKCINTTLSGANAFWAVVDFKTRVYSTTEYARHVIKRLGCPIPDLF